MPEKPGPGCIRGFYSLLVREWILENEGADFYNEFKASLPDELAYFMENAERSGWYPAEKAFSIQQRLSEILGEDKMEELARSNTRKSISGFLRALASFASPLTLAKRSSQFWSRMYSSGRVETEIVSPKEFNVSVYDWKGIRFGCRIIEVWLEEMIKLTGTRNFSIKKVSCVHDGGEFCRWNIKLT